MKLKKLGIVATITAGALGVSTAFAGDMTIEEKFAKVDTNSDGVITEAEYLAQGEKAKAEKFAKMAGDDGELTLDEVKAYYEKKHEKKKKKDKKY